MDAIAGLPTWLVGGIAVGAAASAVVAGLFLLVDRMFPARASATGRSGETVRRTECREYLGAIDEPVREDYAVAGETVAFYLPERDVAITFDPRTYYRLEPSETEPILLEHEVPGHALGHRLPFETPDLERGDARSRTDPVRRAFAELDLPPSADPSAVTRAYRERVTQVHPDQGGDEGAFRELREAYTTAKRHASDD